jgi:hypothetical protein
LTGYDVRLVLNLVMVDHDLHLYDCFLYVNLFFWAVISQLTCAYLRQEIESQEIESQEMTVMSLPLGYWRLTMV